MLWEEDFTNNVLQSNWYSNETNENIADVRQTKITYALLTGRQGDVDRNGSIQETQHADE